VPEIPRKERTHYTLEERNAYGLRLAAEKAYCQWRGLITVERYEWSCACAHLLLRQDHPQGGAGVPDPGCVPFVSDGWYDHVSVYTRRISILDESSNLLLILQHDSGNEFWIRKNPTKADLRLMKQKSRDNS
jgi:hypothetical protein